MYLEYFHHWVNFLVNMESRQDNHDKHDSHPLFHTLICHHLFQNKAKVQCFNPGKYYFSRCSGGTISLCHSFTGSLLVTHLEPREGVYSHMKRSGMLVRNFEINS